MHAPSGLRDWVIMQSGFESVFVGVSGENTRGTRLVLKYGTTNKNCQDDEKILSKAILISQFYNPHYCLNCWFSLVNHNSRRVYVKQVSSQYILAT